MKTWGILLAIACASLAAATQPGPTQPTGPAPHPLQTQSPACPAVRLPGNLEPSLTISAEDLTVAYALDEKEAQERFAKQLLLVEGTIWAKSQKSDFLPYVVLCGHPRKTYDREESCCWLICFLPKSLAETAVGFKTGDKVQLVGTCQGVIPSEGVRVLFSGRCLSRKK
jgi:hypothetical protein